MQTAKSSKSDRYGSIKLRIYHNYNHATVNAFDRSISGLPVITPDW